MFVGTYEQLVNRVEAQRFCSKVEKVRRSLADALIIFEKETEMERSNGGDPFSDDAKEVIEKGIELLKYLTRKSWPETYSKEKNESEVLDKLEVKHGRWIRTSEPCATTPVQHCSECGWNTNFDLPYCSNCGAKMDGHIYND